MRNNILTQSGRYLISNSYETVYLEFDNRKVCIGDFYGDPEGAIIDKNETWVCIYGAGLILYYLKEPFSEYNIGRNKTQTQWKEWGCKGKNIIWIKNIHQVNDHTLQIEYEADNHIKIDTLDIDGF
jgi:hypothetical protein